MNKKLCLNQKLTRLGPVNFCTLNWHSAIYPLRSPHDSVNNPSIFSTVLCWVSSASITAAILFLFFLLCSVYRSYFKVSETLDCNNEKRRELETAIASSPHHYVLLRYFIALSKGIGFAQTVWWKISWISAWIVCVILYNTLIWIIEIVRASIYIFFLVL